MPQSCRTTQEDAGPWLIRSVFGGDGGKRYRAPRDEEEREWVRIFAEHGIELRFEDERYASDRLIFFGRVIGPGP